MSGELSKLSPPKGANRPRRRKGRGHAAGQGKTSGRGMKGQKARKSGGVRPGFEGGQMPIHRRLPKRGFKNLSTKVWAEVRLSDLNRFEEGAVVDQAALKEKGLAKGRNHGVKVLGSGTLEKKVSVRVNRITRTAKEKIEALGGSVELIPDREKWVRKDSRKARRAAAR